MCFSERKCDFLSKTAKGSNFALQCDRKSKKSQNFPVFGALKKIDGFFSRKSYFFRKNINFIKNAKRSQFAVECDWSSKISQKVQNLGFCRKQNRCVIIKKYSFQNRCN